MLSLLSPLIVHFLSVYFIRFSFVSSCVLILMLVDLGNSKQTRANACSENFIIFTLFCLTFISFCNFLFVVETTFPCVHPIDFPPSVDFYVRRKLTLFAVHTTNSGTTNTYKVTSLWCTRTLPTTTTTTTSKATPNIITVANAMAITTKWARRHHRLH